eukprot:519432-Alexandrium_andersonii.AAC.1
MASQQGHACSAQGAMVDGEGLVLHHGQGPLERISKRHIDSNTDDADEQLASKHGRVDAPSARGASSSCRQVVSNTDED